MYGPTITMILSALTAYKEKLGPVPPSDAPSSEEKNDALVATALELAEVLALQDEKISQQDEWLCNVCTLINTGAGKYLFIPT